MAEEVTIDPVTKRPTARGIFYLVDGGTIRLNFSVLTFITEITRPVELITAVLDPEDNPIHRSKWSIDCTDPLLIHGCVTHCLGVEFPRPGVYRVQVAYDGVAVAEQPLHILGPAQRVSSPRQSRAGMR